MTKENKQEPTWKRKGFESVAEYNGWLHFNSLVHSTDGNGHVSVSDEDEAFTLFKEEQE